MHIVNQAPEVSAGVSSPLACGRSDVYPAMKGGSSFKKNLGAHLYTIMKVSMIISTVAMQVTF